MHILKTAKYVFAVIIIAIVSFSVMHFASIEPGSGFLIGILYGWACSISAKVIYE